MVGCGKPVILCNLTGSSVDLQYADAHVNAILQVWYPGARGGKAVADILFGACSPSGKLPVTFYRDLEGIPAFEDYSMKGRTYRYLEKAPLYPFGFGLTYGKAQVKEACLEKAPEEGKALVVKAVLENVGAVGTDEVLQAYIHADDSAFAAPNPSLCCFKRVHLEAGETKEVSVEIPWEALTIVDEEGRRYVDGKNFRLFAGFGQPDERSAALMGTRPVEIRFSIG